MVLYGPSLPPHRLQSAAGSFHAEQQPAGCSAAFEVTDGFTISPTWRRQQFVACGLNNLGNTCYLNSLLQCLTHLPPFGNLCLSKYHSRNCNLPETDCSFCILESHVWKAHKCTTAAISPYPVYNKLHLFSKSLVRGRQEDAHELLRCLVDALERDQLKSEGRYTGSGVVKNATTVVNRLFGGLLRSQVKCMSCNHNSNTYDPFMDLSLELGGCSSVHDALRKFTAVEVLDGSNRYRCEACKKLVAARKHMAIYDDPNILVVHLKRFDGIFGVKINRHIAFDDQLVLDSFLCLPSQPSNGAVPGKAPTASPTARSQYTLQGLVVHQGGSANSGHYFAFVRDSSRTWHRMDDSTVFRVSADLVKGQQAYMLFYVRNAAKPQRRVPGTALALPSSGVGQKRSVVMSEATAAGPPAKVAATARANGECAGDREDGGEVSRPPAKPHARVYGPQLPPGWSRAGDQDGQPLAPGPEGSASPSTDHEDGSATARRPHRPPGPPANGHTPGPTTTLGTGPACKVNGLEAANSQPASLPSANGAPLAGNGGKCVVAIANGAAAAPHRHHPSVRPSLDGTVPGARPGLVPRVLQHGTAVAQAGPGAVHRMHSTVPSKRPDVAAETADGLAVGSQGPGTVELRGQASTKAASQEEQKHANGTRMANRTNTETARVGEPSIDANAAKVYEGSKVPVSHMGSEDSHQEHGEGGSSKPQDAASIRNGSATAAGKICLAPQLVEVVQEGAERLSVIANRWASHLVTGSPSVSGGVEGEDNAAEGGSAAAARANGQHKIHNGSGLGANSGASGAALRQSTVRREAQAVVGSQEFSDRLDVVRERIEGEFRPSGWAKQLRQEIQSRRCRGVALTELLADEELRGRYRAPVLQALDGWRAQAPSNAVPAVSTPRSGVGRPRKPKS